VGNLRVLIVDDDGAIKQAFDLLNDSEDRTFTVDRAAGVDEALESMVFHDPDISLVCVKKDRDNAGAILDGLKEAGLKNRVIVLVDRLHLDAEDDYVERGAIGIIPQNGTVEPVLRNVVRFADGIKAVETDLRQDKEMLVQQVLDLRDSRERAEQQNMEIVGMAEELTVAKTELERLNSQFRDFATASADRFWETDAQFRYTWRSDTEGSDENAMPDPNLGKTPWDMAGADPERDANWRSHRAELEAQMSFRGFEYQSKDAQGHRRWWRVSGRPKYDEHGAFCGYRGVAEDITEQKLADEKMRKLSSAVDQSSSLIVITDVDGRIEYVNKALERASGYSRDEIVGATPSIWKSEDLPPETYAKMWRTILSGETWGGEFKNLRRDGTPYWVVANITPLKDDAGDITHFVGVQEDITEKRDQQAQLIQASKLATLGEMATGVAHELNQPLNIIRMAAESLTEFLDDDEGIPPEFLKKKLSRISAQTQRASAIIDHMRMFGRKSGAEAGPFNIGEAVQAALGLMTKQLETRGIRIASEIPDTPIHAVGEQIQFEQVLLNLMGNARDAIEHRQQSNGSSDYEGLVRVSVSPGSNGSTEISVDDNGGGVPDGMLDSIFEPFFTTKEVGKGTGLGLSISYGIITDMGGNISASNTADGARFKVMLPGAQAPATS